METVNEVQAQTHLTKPEPTEDAAMSQQHTEKSSAEAPSKDAPVTQAPGRPYHLTAEQREALAEKIREALQAGGVNANELFEQVTKELGYPKSHSTFYTYFYRVRNELRQQRGLGALASVANEKDRDADDEEDELDRALREAARVADRGASERREFSVPAGRVSIQQQDTGDWQLDVQLVFGEKAAALAQYRRLEQEVADAL